MNRLTLFLMMWFLASCASETRPVVKTDEVQRRKIMELESQLSEQRKASARWQMITVYVGAGGVVLLMCGTALGAKTRHDAIQQQS